MQGPAAGTCEAARSMFQRTVPEDATGANSAEGNAATPSRTLGPTFAERKILVLDVPTCQPAGEIISQSGSRCAEGIRAAEQLHSAMADVVDSRSGSSHGSPSHCVHIFHSPVHTRPSKPTLSPRNLPSPSPFAPCLSVIPSVARLGLRLSMRSNLQMALPPSRPRSKSPQSTS